MLSKRILQLVVAACTLSISLPAQDTRGMIFGRVVDSQNAPVANATVVVSNLDTNILATLRTNDTGYYEANLLLAGNYRCIERNSIRTIQEAIHTDLAASRAVYTYVFDLCVKLGADAKDLVPFDKYAAAAKPKKVTARRPPAASTARRTPATRAP